MRANILEIIRQMGKRAFGSSTQLAMAQRGIDENMILTARVLISLMKSLGLSENIQDAEFNTFSRWATPAAFARNCDAARRMPLPRSTGCMPFVSLKTYSALALSRGPLLGAQYGKILIDVKR